MAVMFPNKKQNPKVSRSCTFVNVLVDRLVERRLPNLHIVDLSRQSVTQHDKNKDVYAVNCSADNHGYCGIFLGPERRDL